jgi:enamine deaminase RidA (YjgF/YER057c/UK114 family)
MIVDELVAPVTVPGLEPLGKYSQAVVAPKARIAFVAGQIATRDGVLQFPGDVKGQTGVVFENLSLVLEAMGAKWSDVIAMRSFLTSREDIPGYLEARAAYVPNPQSAGTMLVVGGLLYVDAVLEVEAVVAV